MNLTKLKNLLAFYAKPLGLILLVLLITAAAFLLNKPGKEPQQQDTQVKIIPEKKETEKLPTDIKEIRQKIITSQIKNEGGDQVLFEDEAIEIEYVPTTDIFFVKIFKEPVQDYKQQAQNWFIKFGLKQPDLCTLPVRFFIDFELKKSSPNFDNLPDGCTLEKTSALPH